MKYMEYKVNGFSHVGPGRTDKVIGLVYSLR